tara:strand:- start:101 stop:250 length:150 start_codon:yes stop_codon:yes gene_type:complete
VEDIAATFARLVERGAKVLNLPTQLAAGRLACYLQDPEGNWIELIELND